jgi:hypothetical protein
VTVGGLTNGATYRCRAAAANAVGLGAWSGNSSTFGLPAPSAPSAPRNTTATAATATSATVSFSPPASDGGSPITSYFAQCASSDGGTTRGRTGAASPISVLSLTTGATYRCRVRATNALGTGSYSEYSRDFVVLTPPTVPRDVAAETRTATSLWASFSPPASDGGSPVTGYHVQCTSGDGGVGRTVTATVPRTVGTLTAGASYGCRVRAVNAVGSGPYSAYSTAFVLGTPSAPRDVVATPASATSASVSFLPPAGSGSPVTDYSAQCTSSTGGTTRTRTAPEGPVVVTSLTVGATYRCRVRATNDFGTGLYSGYSTSFVL